MAGSTALARSTSAVLWDLRSAWAAGWRISVSLELCSQSRVEGVVTRVSATGALVCIKGLEYPVAYVLAVHKPSRLGDSTFNPEAERWRGRGHKPRESQTERLL